MPMVFLWWDYMTGIIHLDNCFFILNFDHRQGKDGDDSEEDEDDQEDDDDDEDDEDGVEDDGK